MEHVWKVGDEFLVNDRDGQYHGFDAGEKVKLIDIDDHKNYLFKNSNGVDQFLDVHQVSLISSNTNEIEIKQEKKHSHYFKKCPYDYVDVYRILEMFDVTDPCIAHATKKLLCAGARGVKDTAKDIQEAIDTLVRYQEMREEEKDNV